MCSVRAVVVWIPRLGRGVGKGLGGSGWDVLGEGLAGGYGDRVCGCDGGRVGVAWGAGHGEGGWAVGVWGCWVGWLVLVLWLWLWVGLVLVLVLVWALREGC